MNNCFVAVQSVVFDIVAGYCSCPSVTGDQHLIKDLELDSLDLVGLATELEERFGISIADSDMYLAENFGTVDRIVNYVVSRLNNE